MEQVREREEPATSSDSAGPETITSGLGTEGGTHILNVIINTTYLLRLTCNDDCLTV